MACGPNVGASDAGPADPCTGSITRCVGGNLYQECRGGFFEDIEQCVSGEACVPDLGCSQCDPNFGNTCQGGSVHACNADGTVGAFIEQCGIDGCSGGSCGGDQCAGGQRAQFIYVVDDTNGLWSFDPANGANSFTSIGTLNCVAGPSWPGWGNPIATPFSMSVDRNADAWVLYTSGQIFKVSTLDASCQATSFVGGQLGFELFGMGFSSDAPGSQQETLFVAGGVAGSLPSQGQVGRIDPDTLLLTSLGPIVPSEFGPELTGTGDAELFGYYPGVNANGHYVAEISKTTGQNVNGQRWDMTPLPGQVRAWAFAHWGGRFYIFVTSLTSQVLLLDPMTGIANSIQTNIAQLGTGIIVGAGVSTCAPVVVQ